MMELTGNSFQALDYEEDELDKFCDRYKSAPAPRDMTPLAISKQIEVRIRGKDNSVERRTTRLDKTLNQLNKEKSEEEQALVRNKRIKTLEQIQQYREAKAKQAIEKYEKTKNDENELMRKLESIKDKQYSEVCIKKLKDVENAKNSSIKAEIEKEKALQDLRKVRQRKDTRSPFRSAATQQIILPKIN